MTSRFLPPEEYGRLAGTDAELLLPTLGASKAEVFVVEDAGTIVGTVVAIPAVVMECCWMAPERRPSPGICRRLLAGMYAMTRLFGLRQMITLPDNEIVHAMVLKLGGREIPRNAVVVPVE